MLPPGAYQNLRSSETNDIPPFPGRVYGVRPRNGHPLKSRATAQHPQQPLKTLVETYVAIANVAPWVAGGPVISRCTLMVESSPRNSRHVGGFLVSVVKCFQN